ncbi:MAG: hypothetical protein GYA79_03185, partial [Bacteroidetes bacterium]|nr:hypothetical protein [Bacteroidota bacterium]
MNKSIVKEGILGVLSLKWHSMFKNYRKKVMLPAEAPLYPQQNAIV